MDFKLGFFSGAVHEWNAGDVAAATAEAGFQAIEWEVRAGEGHVRKEAARKDAEKRRHESESSAGLSGVQRHLEVNYSARPSNPALYSRSSINMRRLMPLKIGVWLISQRYSGIAHSGCADVIHSIGSNFARLTGRE